MFAQEVTTEPAEPPKKEDLRGAIKSPDFLLYSIVLAGVLFLAALTFWFFDRWRKRPSGETERETSLTLSHFKTMYENGELTEAEYQKIRDKLALKLKAKLGVKSSVSTAPVPPAPPKSESPSDPPKPPDADAPSP